MLRTALKMAAAAAVGKLAHMVYIELRNAHHVWHDPCITPQATRDDIVHVVRTFAGVADAHGLRWWLDYGTLLGAWRLAGQMPFDHDCDLSLLADDIDIARACARELAPHGIVWDVEDTSLFYKGAKIGDADLWYRNGDLLCREPDPSTREGLVIWLHRWYDDFPAAWIENRWEIAFEGDFYPCPNRPERLLHKRYPTCRFSLRLVFPHKQKCWFSRDFWKAAWMIFWSRKGPIYRRRA